ncbi:MULTISPECIES: aromatic ring-hydroxylating dioxygenase subunit alpha [unclassified Sphingobium]|uniref:aromatic ring-hydroxylating dioxygenase subunit alpha n=1 Tax=unclassified Sphingobium TaxID=2611147 RepID=UPI00119C8632|nr:MULTISPECIES: aromatic ring-hydroxylating dioxygenase subunit alpha [unclassified Sphingobium]MBG6116386.1 vanillate O-demethylase monooxygenase subunit [Sphingobium sp. JAI105]TWC97415.1 vanillate demethylase subunit A [Sphingobium sp. AEW010]TWD17773.1 vanillate demethylase subunit A [Sphingobium sp. AEW013]TWD20031.1 vanillate demethylase subunit A [Sphingobium sp. AEW001]
MEKHESQPMPTFPMNAWYVAGWDYEIEPKLLARRICDKPVVLYRCADGTPVALEDACWHRFLPLSAGSLNGDQVKCGYHGLVFNRQGRCTHMPSQETLNPSASVKTYPLVERHRFVWIWMGDPALADPDLIPNLFQNQDDKWAGDGGVTDLACDYRLLVDNLMDLTHETFVHGSSIGNDAVAESPFTVRHDDAAVYLTRWMVGIEPPPFFKKQLGKPGDVDRWQMITFRTPSTVTIDVGVAPTGTGAPEGDRSQGLSGFVIHTATPVNATTCRYFWAFLRDYKLNDQKLTTVWRESARSIFGEDKTVLELQQKAVDEFPEREFYFLNIDGAAMWARRKIDRAIAAEHGPQTPFAVAAE